MDELARMMRAAVAQPPPARIDLDTVVEGERRRSRMFGWTAAGTGAAAAVAAILVLPAMLAPAADGAPPLSFGASTTTAPGPGTPSPTPALCAPLSPSPTAPQPPLQSYDTVRNRPTEPVAQAVPRLTAALRQALRDVLPAGVRVEPLQKGCADPQFQFHPSYREYEVSTRIATGDEAGFLLIRILPTAGADGPACPSSNDPADCERTRFPDGTVASVMRMPLADDLRQDSVLVHRPDGTTAFLIANNYSLGTGPGARGKQRVTAEDVLLTVDQLIAIGRHPGLTLYP